MIDRGEPSRLPRDTLLPPDADESFDRVARLVRRVLDVPTALVTLVDRQRQVFPGAVGLPDPWQTDRESPLTHSFCQYVVGTAEPLIVEDARADRVLADNGAVADIGVVAYAGMPLTSFDGTVIGSLCAIDGVPRRWSPRQLEDLRDLAESCSSELQLREVAAAAQDAARRAEALVTTMPVGYIAVDPDWRVSAVNAEAARSVETAVEDLMGRSLWDLFPVTVGSEFETVVRRVSSTGTAEEFEFRYPEPLDKWFDFRVQNSVDGTSFYFSDVSDRHRVQALVEARAEHDRSVALTLQQALLTDLPRVAGLQIAARYLTATGTELVGGDWYDAVVQPTGALTVSIGDVCGHDIDAAANMGQLRAMLRGFLWDDDRSPAHGVHRLDQALRGLDGQVMATLIAAFVETADADGCTLRWTNAGHPPPILLRPDGDTELLERRAELMLGVFPEVGRSDHTHPLPRGTTLLLYTDGLVETRTDGLDHGIRRLRDALTRHVAEDLPGLLDSVLSELRADSRGDDVAVLAVRIGDRPTVPCPAATTERPITMSGN